MLKDFIAEIVNNNSDFIKSQILRGVELISINKDHELILDEYMDSAEEFAGTTMEREDTLEQIIDFLYSSAVCKRLTTLIAPQVKLAFEAQGENGEALSYVLQDVAAQLMVMGYTREIIELVTDHNLIDYLEVDEREYDAYRMQVSVFLKAVYLHNAPIPTAKLYFVLPTPESIDTDGWWV